MIVRELAARLGLQVDNSTFQKGNALIGGLKTTLIGLGATLTAGAVYHGLKSLVEHTADAAREAGKAAQRVGITREAYEELAFAAEHSGVSAEGMEQSLKFLNRAIYEGGKHSGEVGAIFRRLGVNIGHGTRSAGEVLGDLAARFQAMPDGPQKTASAIRLFGRAGTEMIPMLNKGREGIAELRKEAHELGLVFSQEDVEAAWDFKRASLALHATLESLRRSVAVPLMRHFAEGQRRLVEWLRANREIIRERVVWFVEKLVGALESLSRVIASLIDANVAFYKWLGQLAEKSMALKVAFGILGAGIALALKPGVTVVLALLGAVEEVWGWLTGSRKTLLEDWLGPFKGIEDLFTIKAGDSDLMQAFRLMAFTVKETLDNLEKVARFMGIIRDTKAPQNEKERRLAHWDANSPRSALGMTIAPISRWIYGETGWDTTVGNALQTLLPLSSRFRDPAVGQVPMAPRQSIGNVLLGPVNVTAPPGADPQAWGQSFADSLHERFEQLWDGKMSDAHAAAAR